MCRTRGRTDRTPEEDKPMRQTYCEDDGRWWYEDDKKPVTYHLVTLTAYADGRTGALNNSTYLAVCGATVRNGQFTLLKGIVDRFFTYKHQCEECFSHPHAQMRLLDLTNIG